MEDPQHPYTQALLSAVPRPGAAAGRADAAAAARCRTRPTRRRAASSTRAARRRWSRATGCDRPRAARSGHRQGPIRGPRSHVTFTARHDAEERLVRAFPPSPTRSRPAASPARCSGVVDADGRRAVRVVGARRSCEPETRADGREETWFDLASLTKVIFTTRAHPRAGRGRHHRPRRAADHAAARPAPVRSGCLGAAGHLPPVPRPPDAVPGGRADLHLRPRPDLLRAFVLQREWRGRAAGLFRHQLHPARHSRSSAIAGRGIRDMEPGPRLRLERRSRP